MRGFECWCPQCVVHWYVVGNDKSWACPRDERHGPINVIGPMTVSTTK